MRAELLTSVPFGAAVSSLESVFIRSRIHDAKMILGLFLGRSRTFGEVAADRYSTTL